jgi:hypothetical protein
VLGLDVPSEVSVAALEARQRGDRPGELVAKMFADHYHDRLADPVQGAAGAAAA